MTILMTVLFVFLLALIYCLLFVKKLIEEIDVKEHLIFNLKKALQDEQDRCMSLDRNVRMLTETGRSKNI